jgi:hypothetical protein
MKATCVFLIAAWSLLLAGCANEFESGLDYPALGMGNETLTFKIDKVLQNDVDVKPYLSFFDDVKLTLSYLDGKPSKLTLSETGAPFSVVETQYTDVEWEIYTGKSPYEIRLKQTGEVICHITRNRMVTFTFKLGAPSNNYEYQMLPVEEESENE